jgi:glycosidase
MIARGQLLILIFLLSACTSQNKVNKMEIPAFELPPTWAREAIWYQIFVERFRNGNPENNPTLTTCDNALIDKVPQDWTLTPWGNNWYKQEDWAKRTGLDFYRTIQMRRYGGDLAGVEEKIPYFKELGINAIYFNPINDAPSLHKYDARYYHHIDVTFGDDVEGDMKIIESENHADPSQWKWTNSDKKFLDLVKKLHDSGIKVVLDFSWNHTGNNFWAFKDIEKNLESSPFKDWYHVRFQKDANTGITSFDYDGWLGIKNLPELKKIDTKGKIPGHPYEGNMHAAVKDHIFAVCRRWMDPNGDGMFEDGIDGMRLDVAEHVPMGFWRDFRKFVRSVNPEFYLVGENWWTKWPDQLMDPAPWVKGDVFDAVMHYQWFKVARAYFAQPDDKISIQEFKYQIDSIFKKYPEYTQQAMMNLASSHDSPRLLSAFFNVNKYKFNCKPLEDRQFRTNMPGSVTFHRVKLFLIHQFTFVGSPHIWNGDEMGMTGADDPDNRKPLTWPDIEFEIETQSDFSNYSYAEKPAFDEGMYNFYKSLIKLRKSSQVFTYGTYQYLSLADDKNVLAYYRILNGEKHLVIFNNNDFESQVILPEEKNGYDVAFSYHCDGKNVEKAMVLPPYSAIVLAVKKQ